MNPPDASSSIALLPGARQYDRLRPAQPFQDLREEVVLEPVIERHGRRRADNRDRLGRVQAQLGQNRRIGLEVVQVVLLLETRVAPELGGGAVTLEALDRNHVRHHHGLRQPAVDVVLDRRPLIVEHRRAWDPEHPRGDRDVVGAVSEREVESAPARKPPELEGATGKADRLVGPRRAAVVSDREMADPEPVAELERLGEVAGGDLHLMSLLLQAPDHRCEHQHVRRVGEVDPDLHGAQAAASAATTSSAIARVNTGLIGSASPVRANSSVTGSSSARPSRPTYGAIAG